MFRTAKRLGLVSLVMVGCATATIGGCASHSDARNNTLSTGYVMPVRGLVVPSATHGSLLASGAAADVELWANSRNDNLVNPQPAIQPWALQWVHTHLHERLSIHNGRPREHTTIRTWTSRLAPTR